MPRATARHILVPSEAKCNELKAAIEGGADFAQVAKDNSTGPFNREVVISDCPLHGNHVQLFQRM